MRIAKRLRVPLLALPLLTLSGCGVLPSSALSPGSATATTPADSTPGLSPALSNVVFLGDSLTAGMQNNALMDSEQVHSYPALVAKQAGFSIVQPLVASPGVPNAIQLPSFTFPYNFTQLPGQSTGRENVDQQATNLAVPGANAGSLIFDTPTDLSGSGALSVTNIVLGYPAGSNLSQLQRAIAMQPSTVFLWIGGSDLLPAVQAGDPTVGTPLSTFSMEFAGIITALQTQTSAHLIVANIPDLTLLPQLMPAPMIAQKAAQYTGQPASTIEQDLGLEDSDLVNEAGIFTIEGELGTISAGIPPPPLPPSSVLTASEAAQLRAKVQSFNQVIAMETALAGGKLVDLYSMLNSLQGGIAIGGKTLTLNYLGGFFSLDALHATNTGYAIVANQFIAAMNQALGLSVPAVDVGLVADTDPLFPASAPSVPLQPMPARMPGLPGSTSEGAALPQLPLLPVTR